MKNAIVLISMIILSHALKAQDIYESYQHDVATWSNYQGKWVYDDPDYIHTDFYIYSDYVYAKTNAWHKTYYLGSKITDTYSNGFEIYGWYAVDSDGDDCEFQIEKSDDDVYIRIVYTSLNTAYRYTIDEN